jgi:serine O-acetyltransferase
VKLSLGRDDLVTFLGDILRTHFPCDRVRSAGDIGSVLDLALERIEFCFERVALAGYRDEDGATFDHRHGDQCAALLYRCSNRAFRDRDDPELGAMFSALNRARHALLIMHDTDLPDIFVVPHTVGTVIGKATYGNYLAICQNVTVANDPATRLTFDEGVVLFPGAFVVGTGSIGTASAVAANSTLQYQDLPPNTIAIGHSPDIEFRPRKRDFLARYFLPPYPGSDNREASQ